MRFARFFLLTIILLSHFSLLSAYTITWIKDGDTITTENKVQDEVINALDDQATVNGKIFVGWTTYSSYQNATIAPKFLVPHNCKGDETYYAVYANVTNKMFSPSSSLIEGTYVIMVQKNGLWYSLLNTPSTGKSPTLDYNLTISGDTISKRIKTKYTFNFTTSEGGWTINSTAQPKYYLGTTKSKGNVRVSNLSGYETYTWTIAQHVSNENAFSMMYSYGSMYLGASSSSDVWYNDTPINSGNFASSAIYLFRVTYRNYTTSPSAATVWSDTITTDAVLNPSTPNLSSCDITIAEGKKLTVNASATVHNLELTPGARVAIAAGTLSANRLTLRSGLHSTDATTTFEVPQLYVSSEASFNTTIDTVYFYISVNADHYYPLALPFRSAVADIRYASRPNTDVSAYIGNAINIARYDGKARGEGATSSTKFWSPLTSSDTIEPSTGYIISAKRLKGEAYATLRFTMLMDSYRDTISVGAWGVGTQVASSNQGWNYVANPYMAKMENFSDGHPLVVGTTPVAYATIPSSTMDDYTQVPIEQAQLLPFYGFFIQSPATETLSFNNQLLASPAPQYRAALTESAVPEQKAYIRVSGADMNDQMGLLIHERYSEVYDFNADLSKELGETSSLRSYLMAGTTKMAYLAVDADGAAKSIPVEIRIPKDSVYVWSLSEHSKVEHLTALYLYDRQGENTIVTNLLEEDYQFTAVQGICAGRFSISASFAPATPTDIANKEVSKDANKVMKIFINGNMYILVNGKVYSIEGKEVQL